MRARGAQATDIAVLVVAADDGVMPQTIEAINHAKAANVPMLVAINKMDKPTANPERVKESLTQYNVVAEEWGGDTVMAEVSATTGQGVDHLLEMILLVANFRTFGPIPTARPGASSSTRLDKARGPVATVLIKNGTLNVGDMVIAGTAFGRVRAMVNDRGERVTQAFPSDPVEVVGFGEVPEAGDIMSAVDDDRLSRQVAEERRDKLRAALIKSQQKTTLDDLFSQIQAGQSRISTDRQGRRAGSVEAVKQSLERLSNDEVSALHPRRRGRYQRIRHHAYFCLRSHRHRFNVRIAPMSGHGRTEKVDIRLCRVITTPLRKSRRPCWASWSPSSGKLHWAVPKCGRHSGSQAQV